MSLSPEQFLKENNVNLSSLDPLASNLHECRFCLQNALSLYRNVQYIFSLYQLKKDSSVFIYSSKELASMADAVSGTMNTTTQKSFLAVLRWFLGVLITDVDHVLKTNAEVSIAVGIRFFPLKYEGVNLIMNFLNKYGEVTGGGSKSTVLDPYITNSLQYNLVSMVRIAENLSVLIANMLKNSDIVGDTILTPCLKKLEEVCVAQITVANGLLKRTCDMRGRLYEKGFDVMIEILKTSPMYYDYIEITKVNDIGPYRYRC